jgi:Fur family zinc uptake transcriptional regulator
LLQAEKLCRERGLRLTPIRRRVLELVWRDHQPVGAYDILKRLNQDKAAAPPTVYRALEFLCKQGLVHRIESLNAFLGCADPMPGRNCQFLICRDCGTTEELQDSTIEKAIGTGAEMAGFRMEDWAVEITGLCRACCRRTGMTQ